ncbi:MAG: hypothetical protein AB1646_23825 [Thermodesulfobacteriota bacterium]
MGTILDHLRFFRQVHFADDLDYRPASLKAPIPVYLEASGIRDYSSQQEVLVRKVPQIRPTLDYPLPERLVAQINVPDVCEGFDLRKRLSG